MSKKSLPGTVFFSVWLHATSSTHIRSARALVATEMPGDPTDVVFGDTETRSAATASKPTGIISSSQGEIRSMRREDYGPRASDCTALCTRWKQLLQVWASSLYVVWAGEVPGQGNSKAKTEEQNGKQYTSDLEGWICACALECTRVSSAGTWKHWNPKMEGAERAVFDIFVMRNKFFFGHQRKLVMNPAKRAYCNTQF